MRNELNQIQWLRGIAALLVVFTHFIGKANSVDLTDFSFSKGAIGVDIFFIISGFIMMYIANLKPQTPLKFIVNRAKRILPLHYFFCIALLIVYFIKPEMINSSVDKTYVWESFLLVPVMRNNAEYINPVTWTLCYEAMFYLIFSISLKFKKINSSFAFTSLVIILISIYGFLYQGDNIFVSAATDSISLEFLMGMVIYYLYKSNIKLNPILFIALSFLLYFILTNSGFPRFVKDGVPSALLFIAFINLPNVKLKVFNFLGGISYEIYLCHVIFISLVYVVLNKLGFANIYLFFIMSFSLIVIVSSLFSSIMKKISLLLR